MTRAQYTILVDGFLLLLLALGVVTDSFLLYIIPVALIWITIPISCLLFIRPSNGYLRLPLTYHLTYDTLLITVLLYGGFLITASAYLLVPIAITYSLLHKQLQENK